MSVIKTPIPVAQGGTGATNAADARTNLGISTGESTPIGSLYYFSNAGGDSYITSSGSWLKCDGSIVSQATYTTLYSRVGLLDPGGAAWTSASIVGSALAYGSPVYILTSDGNDGIVYTTTTDFTTWSLNRIGVDVALYAATYGGLYVVGGASGRISFSNDGSIWQSTLPKISALGGAFPLVYTGSKMVGVSKNGLVFENSDGVVWTTRHANSTNTLCSVTYASGIYLICGSGGVLESSTDLVTWTTHTTGTTTTIRSVCYQNSLYLAVSKTGSVFSSTDCTSFAAQAAHTSALGTIAYGGGVYICTITSTAGVRRSTDFSNWTTTTSTSLPTSGIGTFNGSIFIVAGDSGKLATSSSGSSWTARTSGTSSKISDLKYINNLHVYVDSNGGIGTSTNGITWTVNSCGTTSSLFGITWNGTNWFANSLNTIFTSTDAITWSTVTGSGTTSSILALCYDGSQYVYAGQGGVLATSTDCITWTTRTSETASDIQALVYGTELVYSGIGGVIGTSTDGVTWTTQTSGTSSDIYSLTYGTEYVYGGDGGILATSTDGVTWTSRSSGITATIRGLAYANGNYVYVSSAPGCGHSFDAHTWIATDFTGTETFPLTAVVSGGSYFVVAGFSEGLYSKNDYEYNKTTEFKLPTDAGLGITTEGSTNFLRNLYIRAL